MMSAKEKMMMKKKEMADIAKTPMKKKMMSKRLKDTSKADDMAGGC